MNSLLSLLLLLLPLPSTPQILHFSSHAIERIFQTRQPTLFLLSDSTPKSLHAEQTLIQLDGIGIGVLLSIAEAGDTEGMFRRLTSFLDIKAQYPQFVYISEKLEKYLYSGKVQVGALVQFVARAREEVLEPYVKSAPVPIDNSRPVKTLVASTFKKTLSKTLQQYLVMFYAPWCQHCTNMMPAYEQAAQLLLPNSNIVLTKIDVTQNEINSIQIEGLPTLLFFHKERARGPVLYTGGRTVGDIVAWLRENVGYQWVEVEGGLQGEL